jgi:hypothetical protein
VREAVSLRFEKEYQVKEIERKNEVVVEVERTAAALQGQLDELIASGKKHDQVKSGGECIFSGRRVRRCNAGCV